MNKVFICTKNILIVFSILSTLDPIKPTQDGNSDLPDRSHIWNYMGTIEKMLDLCATFKSGTNPNIYFAIFLVNVNLMEIFQNRLNYLPKRLQDNLISLLRKSTKLSKELKERETRRKIKLLFSLFSNETAWISRIKEYTFVMKEHQTGNKQRLLRKFHTWYKNLLEPATTGRPDNPNLCILNLASTREKPFGSAVTPCGLGPYCRKKLLFNYDYGFNLSSRLLYLLLAKYGRGCSIFISVIDDDLRKRFCEVTYAETEYIIDNNEKFNMLIEKMTLCSLNGHPEFLKVSWLSHVIKILSAEGCISTDEKDLNMGQRHKRRAMQHSQRQNGDYNTEICTEETVSATAALFASAVRYTIASHYPLNT